MASKEQIIALAESGIAPALIAKRAGVSESYISQVLSEDSIRARTIKAQLAVLDERTARDAKYDAIEDELLEKTKKLVPALYKPQDIIKVLLMINRAERRGATSQQLAELANSRQDSVVPLELPERVRTKIIKSHTREVISVNGRGLITKDSRTLLQEIESEKTLLPNDPLDVDLDLESVNSHVSLPAPTETSQGFAISPNGFSEKVTITPNQIEDDDLI